VRAFYLPPRVPDDGLTAERVVKKILYVAVWLSAKEAAKKLSLSTDSIERRALPWQETQVPHKIRYKLLQLDKDGEEVRRYYEPDCEALLKEPPQRRRGPELIPDFA
jgi:hypothetical protein